MSKQIILKHIEFTNLQLPPISNKISYFISNPKSGGWTLFKGKESKNLPPTANKTAKANEVIKIKILTNLLIFLVEAFAINLSNK